MKMTNFDVPEQGKRRSRAERLEGAEQIVEKLEQELPLQGKERKLQERNLTIWRAHLNCVSDYDLAATFDLTPRMIGNIIREQRKNNRRLSQRDPVEVVEEISEKIDAAISELALAAASEKGSVKVTAIMGRINSLIQKGKWLQSAGLLPQEASELRVHMTASNMAQNILTVLEDRGMLTPELMAEIHAGLGQGDIVDADVVEDEDDEMVELEAGELA